MAARNVYEEKIRLYVEASGDKEIEALAKQLTQLGDGADTSADQAQALVAELEKLATTSKNIKAFTTLKAAIAETGDKLQVAKDKLATLGAEFDRADVPTKKLQTSLAKAATEVQKLTVQQNKQQVELSKTTTALRATGIDTDKLGDAYHKLQAEMGAFSARAGDAANAMQRTAKDSKAAASGVSSLDRAATASSKSLSAIATRLVAVSGAATAAIAGLAGITGASLFAGALRSAATLEDALSQVRAVSGATAEEMVKLKEAAEQGGAATRFSSLEAAQGLGELARATGNAQTAIAALPATLALAQASGIGVAEAATLMTTTLTQFGLGADQATRVADVMAKEVNSTTDSMVALGNALTYAAPLAKQLGLDVEDTAAIIGVLADEGYRGERAGTALRNVFSEMSDPASEFSKALRDLGIESSDFAVVIQQLADKGDLGREALLKLDAAARPAITSLVEKGGEKLVQLESVLRNAAGAAEETAQMMGENLPGALEAIKDTYDRTRRSLVEPLLEPLREELFALSTELSEFAKTPEFEQIKGALKTLFIESAKAARDLLENVDFNALAKNISDFATDSDGSLTAFKESLGEIADAVKIVGDTISIVFNGVQAIVFGLGAVVTRVVSGVAEAVDQLTGPARQVLEFLGILDKGQFSLLEFGRGMGAVSDDFGRRMVENAAQAGEAIQNFGGGTDAAMETVVGALGNAGDASQKLAEASGEAAAAASAATQALEGQAQGAADTATATATAAGTIESSADRVKKAFADMGITAQADLQRAAESASRNFDLIRQAVGKGEATAEDARRAFAAYAEAARAAVADSDSYAKQRVESELQMRAATLGVTAALDASGNAGANAGEKITSGANKAASALQGVGDAASSAADKTNDVASAASKVGSNAKTGASGVREMSTSFVALSDEAANALAALGHLVGSQNIYFDNVNKIMGQLRQQKKELEGVNKALDDQLATLDPLAQKMKELRQQFNYVDDNTLRSIAEKQQRLDQEAKRVAEERTRAQQEATRDQKPAEAVQIAKRVQEESAAAATAVSDVLERVRTAATAMDSASTRMTSAKSGEIVLRIISEAGPGAQTFKLTDAQIREISGAVVRALQQSQRSST